jgi:hypothetical protein
LWGTAENSRRADAAPASGVDVDVDMDKNLPVIEHMR